MREILKRFCFSPHNEPHTANLCFLVVLIFFLEIHRELLFLVKKVSISEMNTEKHSKFVFLNMFEKGQVRKKFWICLNNFF